MIFGLPFPDETGVTPDVPRDFEALTSSLDGILPWLAHGPLQQGVVNTAAGGSGAMLVTPGSAGLTVQVATGFALIKRLTGDFLLIPGVLAAASGNVALTAAHATLPRIDQVLWKGTATGPAITIDTGTATAGATLDNRNGATSDAALNAASTRGWIRLADVLVPAAAATVLAANIRDRRPFARGFRYRSGDASLSLSGGTASNTNVDFLNGKVRAEIGVNSKLTVQVYLAVTHNTPPASAIVDLFLNGASVTVRSDVIPAAGVYQRLYQFTNVGAAGSNYLELKGRSSVAGTVVMQTGALLVVEDVGGYENNGIV